MWIELTNRSFVNLELIEAIVPGKAPGTWRFFHPRTQRGGRPYGRPPDRPQHHDDDAGCWVGQPVDEARMLAMLRSRGITPAEERTSDGPAPTPAA